MLVTSFGKRWWIYNEEMYLCCKLKMYLCCQLVSGGKWRGIIELYMSGLLNCTCRCCFGNQEFKYRIMIAECFITWWSYKFLKSNAFDIENNIGRLISGLESFFFISFQTRNSFLFRFGSRLGYMFVWLGTATYSKQIFTWIELWY